LVRRYGLEYVAVVGLVHLLEEPTTLFFNHSGAQLYFTSLQHERANGSNDETENDWES